MELLKIKWLMALTLTMTFGICLVFGIDTQSWVVNISNNDITEFNNIWWKQSIGSGHAALTLRKDWREQMQSTHNVLKFKYVRFVGIFDDDVGVVNNINDYSYINIDKIYRYFLSINMKPFICITYLPYKFASNNCENQTINNHNKPCAAIPDNYNVWYNFIKQWTQHLVDVFDVNEVLSWKFEVYNEPNNLWNFEEYLIFYNYTATAIKSVNDGLSVGGPVSSLQEWIVPFCNATKILNIPLDFISTHAYPNQRNNGIRPNYLNAYYDALNKLLNQCKAYNLPVYITEWNSGCCADQNINFYNNDNFYASSFLIFMVNHLQSLFINNSLLQFMSYWAVSDIFAQNGFISDEFCDYYGLTTIRGIRKPIFRAFQLLEKYTNNVTFKYLTYNMDNIGFTNNSIEMFCLKVNSDHHHYVLFISNWNLLNLNITDKILNIYINNYIDATTTLSSIIMYRIDNNNTNPLQKWINMRSPKYPTIQQLHILNVSSQLIPISNTNYTQINQTTLKFRIKIPIYGVVVLDLLF